MLQLILLLWLCKAFCNVENSIISTTTGVIRGKLVRDDIFGKYYSYEGIPYAEPPVGELRFRPPLPKQPWRGVLDATRPGSVCPQPPRIYSYEQMSEDCLYLNIFTPENKLMEQLPVVIYIHQGGFTTTSGNAEDFLGPQLFIQNNIILVTINFRLGVLGFLSLDIEEASGNAGVKDVLLAIEWINRNIGRFGGNKNLITVMGQNAGAALTHALLLTVKSTGLFQKVILLSESITSPMFLQRRSRETALQLGLELGLEITDTKKFLKQLETIDFITLVVRNITQNDPRRGFYLYIPFAISIEIESPIAIITNKPWKLVKEGIKNIPIVTGFNNRQGLQISSIIRNGPNRMINRLNRNFKLSASRNIYDPSDSPLSNKLANSFMKFYFNNRDI